MILNDLERRNSLYLAFFSPNSTDFQADYITMVEDNVRKILSPSSSLPLLAKSITHPAAIAEHLVNNIIGRIIPKGKRSYPGSQKTPWLSWRMTGF